MSFASRETSTHDGAPVYAYRFSQASNLWLWTSADTDLVLPVGTFTRETIDHGEIRFDEEDGAGQVQISVPRTNPVAALFIGQPPAQPIGIIMYAAHRGDEADTIPIFIGMVRTCRFEGSEAKIVAAPITRAFEQQFPARTIAIQCQHFLYTPGCGVDPNDYRETVTVTTVTGRTITSNDFLAFPAGYLENGKVTHAPEGSKWITSHVGDTITIKSAFKTLASLDVVTVLPGCNRLARGTGHCKTRFTVANPADGNVGRHMGFFAMPSRNPHTSGLG